MNALENNYLNPSRSAEVELKKQEAYAKAGEVTLQELEGLVAYREAKVAHLTELVREIDRALDQPGLSLEARRTLRTEREHLWEACDYARAFPTTPLGLGGEALSLGAGAFPLVGKGLQVARWGISSVASLLRLEGAAVCRGFAADVAIARLEGMAMGRGTSVLSAPVAGAESTAGLRTSTALRTERAGLTPVRRQAVAPPKTPAEILRADITPRANRAAELRKAAAKKGKPSPHKIEPSPQTRIPSASAAPLKPTREDAGIAPETKQLLSKEQPWVVREGQEWKGKVVGQAQQTKTEGHAFRSYREAIAAAKSEETEKVFLNKLS